MKETTGDTRYIEFQSTLEIIERTNQMLKLHREAHEPSRLSISNYEDLLDDYYRQLAELLLEFGVKAELSRAA